MFIPSDIDQTNDLIAHVIEASPAYRAGIRNGDVLLMINDMGVTNWRTDHRILPLHRFGSQAVGTKLKLVLVRDDVPYETIVTLEELPAVD